MPTPTTASIEVFRPGSFVAQGGEALSFSAADLQAVAANYDAENHPAPVVVGHPATDAPAYGWAAGFSYDGDDERLRADVTELEPAFAEAVQAGRYKKISMAFFKADAPSNPKPGALYPKHIGFLGAAAPAVSGLKPVTFAGDDDECVTLEFADPAFRDVATVFQSLRDLIIEKFGRETADSAAPQYRINWVEDASQEPVASVPETAFSEPQKGTEPMPETSKPGKDDTAAFAEREAVIAKREAALLEKEAAARHAEHTAFADGLVNDARLLPAQRDAAVKLLDELAAPAAVAAFSEGASPAEALKSLLKAAPQSVQLGAFKTGDDPEIITDDPQAIAAQALKYQADAARDGITVSTAEAVLHVSKGEKQ